MREFKVLTKPRVPGSLGRQRKQPSQTVKETVQDKKYKPPYSHQFYCCQCIVVIGN